MQKFGLGAAFGLHRRERHVADYVLQQVQRPGHQAGPRQRRSACRRRWSLGRIRWPPQCLRRHQGPQPRLERLQQLPSSPTPTARSGAPLMHKAVCITPMATTHAPTRSTSARSSRAPAPAQPSAAQPGQPQGPATAPGGDCAVAGRLDHSDRRNPARMAAGPAAHRQRPATATSGRQQRGYAGAGAGPDRRGDEGAGLG